MSPPTGAWPAADAMPAPAADAMPAPPADAGDDQSPSDPDVTPSAACLEMQASTAVLAPGASRSGDLAGADAAIDVAHGACDDQRAPFAPPLAPGPDEVVALVDLEPGARYRVSVNASFDAAVYVATGCAGEAGPAAGQCPLYLDAGFGVSPEAGTFVAPAGGTAWAIVDHYRAAAPANGAYTLSLSRVDCETDFHCGDPAAPVCDAHACVAGPSACAEGDAAEDADDGPAGATPIADGGVATGSICAADPREADWFTLAAGGGVTRLALDWADASAALGVTVYDGNGGLLARRAGAPPLQLAITGGVAPLRARVTRTDGQASAVAYALSAGRAGCGWDGDCTTPGLPLCGPDLECVASDATSCTGDDEGEDDDDGAGLGRALVPVLDGAPAAKTAAICSAPANGGPGNSRERDWYRIEVGAGQRLDVELAWSPTVAGEDLDLYLHDARGAVIATGATTDQPERLGGAAGVGNLAPGTYYVRVVQYEPIGRVPAVAYTLSTRLSTAP